LTPSGTGTRLTLTEQGVYYMPDDAANREQGTNDLMDALQALVDG
jgi:hypothetical protein